MTALALNLDPMIHLTNEQLYPLCQANRELRFAHRGILSISG
jgi:hypothetical protein